MGSALPSFPLRALTLPALLPLEALPNTELCPACVRADGLCGREDCRRAVLPQLAKNGGWLRLMGEAHTEQTKRQAPEPAERKQLERIARRNARKVARSKRGGMFGLLKAIRSAQ